MCANKKINKIKKMDYFNHQHFHPFSFERELMRKDTNYTIQQVRNMFVNEINKVLNIQIRLEYPYRNVHFYQQPDGQFCMRVYQKSLGMREKHTRDFMLFLHWFYEVLQDPSINTIMFNYRNRNRNINIVSNDIIYPPF